MTRRAKFPPALIASVLLALTGCSPHGSPDVVLITIDTLRADHVSIYGSRRARTPHLDALGRAGAVFEWAYCDVTWTTPSMASTLTGTFSNRHGLRSAMDRLPPGAVTIADLLAASGYQTAAVVGSYPVSSHFGLDRGFARFDDTFSQPLMRIPKSQDFGGNILTQMNRRSDSEVSEIAITTARDLARETRPFFLWVHYYGPHLVPNAALTLRQNNTLHIETYSRKVSKSDSAVGRLLQALNERASNRELLVIVHSDHGEALGEHDYVGHGRYFYQDNLRVPLILHWPERIPAGTRFAPAVANVDIAATILDAARVEAPDPLDGVSLLRALEGEESTHESVYLETWLPAHQLFAEWDRETMTRVGVRRRGVLRGRWKLVETTPVSLIDDNGPDPPKRISSRFAQRQLFDLAADPGELRPLPGDPETGEVSRELHERLASYTALADELESSPATLPDDHRERLRSLGYVE